MFLHTFNGNALLEPLYRGIVHYFNIAHFLFKLCRMGCSENSDYIWDGSLLSTLCIVIYFLALFG
jgi:hypothetical protein